MFRLLMVPFQRYMRKQRMKLFSKIISPIAGMRVLDLGGQPAIWDDVDPCLNITCLNLPGIADQKHLSHHNITFVVGDACNMPEFNFGDFDIVFSNSVLEHVGDGDKQKEFAREVQRLSGTFWVQTPSKLFPIEAHCGMPFWWYYPIWLRSFFLRRWEKKLPAWTEMVSSTTYISRKSMVSLFPDSSIVTEWFVLPKSIIAYKLARIPVKTATTSL